jgi:hypothetical protein
MTSKGFINHIEYYNNPSGSLLMGAENYHHPFRKTENMFFNKHHKSLYHKEGGISDEFKRTFHQHHRSVTNDINNLQNFNPNIGITYYKEHDTNKMLNGAVGTRPRYELFNFRDTSIPDKIDNWKKDGDHPHTRPEHSHKLMIRRI